MNDEPRAAAAADVDQAAEKRPWNAPSLSEVDFVHTSTNPTYNPSYDGGQYDS